MKTPLFVFLLASGTAIAQTGLIAHKSHSGTAATFAFAGTGNFGAPPASVESIRWVNDTTVIQKMDRWGGKREDTIYNHPLYSDPNIPLDSIQRMSENWHGPIEMIDTMNRYKHEAPSGTRRRNQKAETWRPVNSKPAPVIQEGEPEKRENTLWLLIIGGGTFTGLMLVGRKRKKSVELLNG